MTDGLHAALRAVPPIEDEARRAADAVAARLAEEADVAYARVDSPFGPLLAAATARGLVRLAFPERSEDEVLSELVLEVSPRVLESPRRLDAWRRELEEYFEGRRHGFDLHVDLSPARGFRRRVLRATARIPFGSVATYRDVARRAGNPDATRAAGSAVGWNRVPIVIPCHRVVRSDGSLGDYGGGVSRKEFLLKLEGAL